MLTDLFLSHNLAIEKVGREKKMDICPPLAEVVVEAEVVVVKAATVVVVEEVVLAVVEVVVVEVVVEAEVVVVVVKAATVVVVEVVVAVAVVVVVVEAERERNVLFNDALNTFYLRLYGVRHMVKDHSDSEKGNPLPPHRLLLSINSKGSFICNIPQT